MARRSRRWARLDHEYLKRPRIAKLRSEFGAAGPLVLLAIVLEVEATPHGRATDSLEARYGDIGALAGVSSSEARAVAERAIALGLLRSSQERDRVTGREVEVLTLLKRRNWAPESQSAKIDTRPRRVRPDQRVTDLLEKSDRPMPAQEIADVLGLKNVSSFRTRLARLRAEGAIAHVHGKGYVAPDVT